MHSFDTQLLTNNAELPKQLDIAERLRADKERGSFKDTLSNAVEQLAEPQQAASKAIEQYNKGTDGELHQTLMAVDKADVSLKFFVTVRNKCLEAYREIMRMGS